MTQEERLEYLVQALLAERGMPPPAHTQDKKRLFRALCNTRPPLPADPAFLRIQDAYLTGEIERRGITGLDDLEPLRDGLYVWRGDITALRADGVVNAANSRLLGCFVPCHGCIDNAIHTFAGVQLRLACEELMERQGGEEPVGRAKLTPAFNLPSRYVLHTVGPYIDPDIEGAPADADCRRLASCYRACLALADHEGLASLAFCCISTGEFHFPHERAAAVAVETVLGYLHETQSKIKVIFNVFQETDELCYRRLLGAGR